MNNIKNFSIFKAKEKKNEKSPDYNISLKVGEKYLIVGGCWLKEGKSGKYFSCSLSNGYKEIPGYCITEDLEERAREMSESSGEATKKEVEADGIPF
jgi:uncharacterized protein (DUF736 family)